MEWLPDRVGEIMFTVLPVEGRFSRGKGLNLAAANATFGNLLFLDVDMLVSRDLLALANYYARDGRVFAPVYRDLGESGEDIGERLDGYGCIAISSSLFKRTAKWPEFYRRGGEDAIFFERLSGRGPVVRHEVERFWHQWHPKQFTQRLTRELQARITSSNYQC
jgi:hypothetical protein